MTGILEKHAGDNYYTRTFSDFEQRLERGRIGVKMVNSWDVYGSRCPTCDESCIAFKYPGHLYYLHESAGFFIIHQCAPNKRYQIGPEEGQPEPEYGERDDILEAQAEARGEIYPDDPNVRDGDGNIRGGGWSDDTWGEPRSFADDPYNYPDIPYVDPTR